MGGEQLHVIVSIPAAHLALLVVGLLAVAAASLVPARRAAAIPPLAALRRA